jgi:hypothetical protein
MARSSTRLLLRGKTEEEAHVEQVAPKENKPYEEAPAEQDESSSEDDGDEEGAAQGETSNSHNRSTTC